MTMEKMVDAMAYRGPDSRGVYTRDGVGLGACRLRIFDLSDAGDQPFTSPDGRYVTVLNGEIYNHAEIRAELPDLPWTSTCDTEVLLQAYIHYGEDCLEKFNGMFAFAVWDNQEKKLFGARDRVGIKPFYWTKYGDRIIFGSEIKTILSTGYKAQPDYSAMSEYLKRGYYDHTEHTFFKGIHQLEPGHTITIKNGEMRTRCYWHLPSRVPDYRYTRDEEFLEDFKTQLKDAVKLRLRSDVPVGLHISGGVDSTLLASIMQGLLDNNPMQLFSYVYDESVDERPHAENIARKLGCPIEFSTLRPEEVPDLVPRTLHHEEQPFPGLITVSKHKLFRLFKDRGVTVVLGGHGGDEMAGGYVYFVGSYLLDVVRERGYDAAMQELNAFSKTYNIPEQEHGKFILRTLTAYLHGSISADGSPLGYLDGMNPDFWRENEHHPASFERPFMSHSLNNQYQDLRYTKLPRVLRTCDRASMAVGREKRVPFLDHRLVEKAFSTPTSMRIRNGQLRYFWRQIGEHILVDELNKTPKRAVVDPQRDWFEDHLSDWIRDVFSSQSFKERGLFQQDKVLAAYENYRGLDPKSRNSVWIWQCLILELWHQQFID
jgi:asparagine synthase (glutamine-hydrolysing)